MTDVAKHQRQKRIKGALNEYQVKLVANACATMDLEIAGEIIPADTVQKTILASLEGVFATVI